MDWKFFITTAIAVLAAAISWNARREAKRASSATYALQTRLEQYEHFPIIQVAISPDGDRIKVILTNSSAKNAVSSFKIKFVLRISAGDTFHVSKENYVYQGGFLAPNSSTEIYPDIINECIAHAIPPLKQYPPDQSNFVLRAYVECTPPNPKSEKIHEQGVGFFVYEQDRLALRTAATTS
ncbi:Signal sequence receptor subunit alpha [Pseudomonas sp. IT-P100]|uniref:hypothetical protein n=1 Tax=Pseudomonas sp. IT-P100 TaxID=3026452 RepID=UPI0039DFEBA1